MTEPDPCLDEHARIALNAYQDCLKACAAFEGFFLPELEHSADQIWWKGTFESNAEELAQRIQRYLLEANMTGEGCLELGAPSASVTTPTPQRIHWRGHRQKVYQLVAWGLLGEAPTKRRVVRHLCNNRLCIHPEHLEVGTQAQNLRDQQHNRSKNWPHQ